MRGTQAGSAGFRAQWAETSVSSSWSKFMKAQGRVDGDHGMIAGPILLCKHADDQFSVDIVS